MLEIKALSVKRARRAILSKIDLTLPTGSMTALIGRNGSGKSTLISALGGICPSEGEVLWDGEALLALSPRERARRLSLLPQLLAAPHMTVRELALLGRHPHGSVLSPIGDADRSAAAHALRAVGISHLSDRFLDEISGGERQSAYLAMILTQDAPLWLLDEPTTYMDPSVAARFMALLSTLKRERQKTVLVAMHDLNLALRHADRIALLDGTRLAFCGTVGECLSTDVIERTFSVRRVGTAEEPFFIG